MASVSRTAQFTNVFKVLRKHYRPVTANPERPVLEHLLFACCLENAPYQAAEEAFAALVETFFDWNEMRVTSVSELSEVTAGLPDPCAAANRFKRVLQGVFEATYDFDLENWRKNNLGPTIKWLKKIEGTTHFTIAYVVQSALGGHAIPIDSGVVEALRVVELVSDKDVEQCVVPGLERAISKAKGVEFGSMLHQLGADFTANPYSPEVRRILLQINPDCQDRLPKRRTGRKAGTEPSEEPPEQTGDEEQAAEQTTVPTSKEKPSPTAKKKPVSTRKKTAPSNEETAAAKDFSKPDVKKKKSATEGLSKRKPR